MWNFMVFVVLLCETLWCLLSCPVWNFMVFVVLSCVKLYGVCCPVLCETLWCLLSCPVWNFMVFVVLSCVKLYGVCCPVLCETLWCLLSCCLLDSMLSVCCPGVWDFVFVVLVCETLRCPGVWDFMCLLSWCVRLYVSVCCPVWLHGKCVLSCVWDFVVSVVLPYVRLYVLWCVGFLARPVYCPAAYGTLW